jgi:hypothetical protein
MTRERERERSGMRIAVAHGGNVTTGGCFPERPKMAK